jgi:hypothetical protein
MMIGGKNMVREDIVLANLSPLDRELAKACMKNPNAASLTSEEISLFLKKKSDFNKFIGDTFIYSSDRYALQPEGTSVSPIPTPEAMVLEQKDGNSAVVKAAGAEKSDKIKKIHDMITSFGKVKKDSIDIDKWANMIYDSSQNYNVPAELIVAIISRETGFKITNNVNNGSGPMQMTTIAVADFFPSKNNDWYKIYEMMDKNLLDSIVYKDNNHQRLRAGDASTLRLMANKDLALGIRMGLLTFEMNFIKSVALMKFGKDGLKNKQAKADSKKIIKTIEGLKNGSIKLTKKEAKECVTFALQKYNTVFKNYAPQLVDSLEQIGVNFLDFNNLLNQNKLS